MSALALFLGYWLIILVSSLVLATATIFVAARLARIIDRWRDRNDETNREK